MRLFVFIFLIINEGYIIACAKELKTLGRIINGHDAEMGQFPYAVRLETIVAFCSGSLINPKWVLTAAHCVAKVLPAVVYLGSNVKGIDEVVYHVPTYDIRIHPNYKTTQMHNDIALIKIPLTKLNNKIATLPLPSSDLESNYEKEYVIACGWGLTKIDGVVTEKLQWTRFQIQYKKKCQSLRISRKQICTNMDTARIYKGDSGGPLVLRNTGELIGIVSALSLKKYNNRHLVVFTRVTSYLEWIKTTIKKY